MEITSTKKSLRDIAAEFCRDEYTDYIIYSKLAAIEFNERRRDVLSRLADVERRHYEFWRRYTPSFKPPITSMIYAYLLAFLRMLLGATFVIRLFERGEQKAVEKYREALGFAESEEEKRAIEAIIKDEEEHEELFIAQLDEAVVKYMSALVLGMADAIIEITGTHAGSLGTTSSTIITGAVGLVVGTSAAISMASASYLQTKHEVGKSPRVAALVTGFGYIVATALMSLPFFLIDNIFAAFAVSIVVSVLLALLFTFQGSVYTGTDFRRGFVQTVGLLLGVAVLAYILGDVLSAALGIRALIK
jgi:VIT1/CCC1 family predicted Fe2+/Mn2+ transporter